MTPKVVGILAIQGDVEAHARAIRASGGEPRSVLRERDLEAVDALVIPGGESTTIAKGLDRLQLWKALREFPGPMLGTCAGAILMAHESRHHPVQTLDLIDCVALRNAYGTQVDSFAARATSERFPDLRCLFIRAPRLADLGTGVEVLARVDQEPVLVREGRYLAATFHPELTEDVRIHQLLLEGVRAC